MLAPCPLRHVDLQTRARTIEDTAHDILVAMLKCSEGKLPLSKLCTRNLVNDDAQLTTGQET